MCGQGTAAERLANMAESALMRLEDHDLPEGPLRDDLKYVLDWTKRNWRGGQDVARLPDDAEWQVLIDKMFHILLETHRAG
jgi:hypothetical protein